MGRMSKASALQATLSKVVEEMTPALRAIYEDMRSQMLEHFRHDVLLRYDWGAQVLKIVSSDREEHYGQNAVKQLALALGQNEKSLYEYQKAPRVYTRAQVEHMIKAAEQHGVMLTYSQVAALSCFSGEKERAKLEAKVVEGACTAKDLEALLAKKYTAKAIKPRVKTLLGRIHETMALIDELIAEQEVIDDLIMDMREPRASELDQGLVESISTLSSKSDIAAEILSGLRKYSADVAVELQTQLDEAADARAAVETETETEPEEQKPAKKRGRPKKVVDAVFEKNTAKAAEVEAESAEADLEEDDDDSEETLIKNGSPVKATSAKVTAAVDDDEEDDDYDNADDEDDYEYEDEDDDDAEEDEEEDSEESWFEDELKTPAVADKRAAAAPKKLAGSRAVAAAKSKKLSRPSPA